MSVFSELFRREYPVRLDGYVDWHCHLLPGVDDGVQTIEESLEILDCYERAGIREVWLTPHIMEDIPNTPKQLKARFKELTEAYGGNVRLRLSAENMIDGLFLERLEAGELLTIGDDGKMLLVETSYFNAPMELDRAIESIKRHGYFPLLAHPERYNYINSMAEYRRLKKMGVRFQLNLMSLSGHYGPVVRKKAHELLKEGLYERSGSDLHRKEHIEIIRNMRIRRSAVAAVGSL